MWLVHVYGLDICTVLSLSNLQANGNGTFAPRTCFRKADWPQRQVRLNAQGCLVRGVYFKRVNKNLQRSWRWFPSLENPFIVSQYLPFSYCRIRVQFRVSKNIRWVIAYLRSCHTRYSVSWCCRCPLLFLLYLMKCVVIKWRAWFLRLCQRAGFLRSDVNKKKKVNLAQTTTSVLFAFLWILFWMSCQAL